MPLGILYNGLYDATEFLTFAREAEALGVTSAWVAEQPGHRDGFVVASALAQQTRLQLFVGAISPFSHHPMTIAMSAAALNELAPGRVGLVMGAGGGPGQAAYGVRVEQPTETLTEAIESVRGLLAGQTLDRAGRFTFRQARLGLTAPAMPILMAAIGPRMQATAGTVADGVVFSSGHSPRFLVESQRRVQAAHAASPRAQRPFRQVAFVVASTANDRARALQKPKALLSYLFSTPHKAEDWALNGTAIDHAAILAALERHAPETAANLISDDIVSVYTAAGEPAAYQERLRAYQAVGLDELVLAPLGTAQEKRLAVVLALEAGLAPERG